MLTQLLVYQEIPGDNYRLMILDDVTKVPMASLIRSLRDKPNKTYIIGEAESDDSLEDLTELYARAYGCTKLELYDNEFRVPIEEVDRIFSEQCFMT